MVWVGAAIATTDPDGVEEAKRPLTRTCSPSLKQGRCESGMSLHCFLLTFPFGTGGLRLPRSLLRTHNVDISTFLNENSFCCVLSLGIHLALAWVQRK